MKRENLVDDSDVGLGQMATLRMIVMAVAMVNDDYDDDDDHDDDGFSIE